MCSDPLASCGFWIEYFLFWIGSILARSILDGSILDYCNMPLQNPQERRALSFECCKHAVYKISAGGLRGSRCIKFACGQPGTVVYFDRGLFWT